MAKKPTEARRKLIESRHDASVFLYAFRAERR
jgi:hypothetical protein